MEQLEKNQTQLSTAVEIVYYTDPLCCWSWAMKPQLQQLKEQLGQRLFIRYCMGGMLPDWSSYHDTLNSVSRPAQMGPLWMEVHHRTAVPIYDRIWIENPPASSYPACIAVKCAALQSAVFEERMLELLQEAVMLRGNNIAKNAALLETAERMPEGFNLEQFEQDLMSGKGLPAFRKDMDEVLLQQVTRFPAMRIAANRKALMITGYRRFEVLRQAVEQLSQ